MSAQTQSKNILADPSLWLLLASNAITIYFALKEGWNLSALMWIYWFQSVTIGIFNFIRILQLKDFSTKGFKINNQQVNPTKGTKIFTAFFFLFHYGLFHLVYFIFLLVNTFANFYEESPSAANAKFIFLASLIFFINHLFSYFYNSSRDTEKQNIGALMFYPYARIIPMHLTIIFGGVIGNAFLPIFLILKTIADAIMHIIEHRVIRRGEKENTGG